MLLVLLGLLGCFPSSYIHIHKHFSFVAKALYCLQKSSHGYIPKGSTPSTLARGQSGRNQRMAQPGWDGMEEVAGREDVSGSEEEAGREEGSGREEDAGKKKGAGREAVIAKRGRRHTMLLMFILVFLLFSVN